jgi:uncharacterized protein (TIGR00255 family)
MTINSMTGFGSAFGDILGFRSRLEIKTLNNRYREFVMRVPHFLGAAEEPLKKLIMKTVSRGRVELWLQVDLSRAGAPPEPSVNMAAAGRLWAQLRELAEGLGLPGEVTLADLLALERHIVSDEAPRGLEDAEPGAVWGDLRPLAERALGQLAVMRAQEGAELQGDIEGRLDSMQATLKELKNTAASQPQIMTKRYQARLEELAESMLDPVRLAQEAAVLAERLDITEEITRFHSHIKNFRSLLALQEPVGRRLEFLLQELLREANTMGSKSQSLPITELVLSFKSELEKIREQVLNVE